MFLWTILFIFINFISVVMLLYYSIKTNMYFLISQLICMITMIALMYSIHFNIDNWIKIQDWSALMDVIPITNDILFYYLTVVIIVNIISTIFFYKKVRYKLNGI